MDAPRGSRLALALTTAAGLVLAGSPALARPYIECGDSDAVACYGTPRGDTIKGSRSADRIYGRAGDDAIKSGGGNDVVKAGSGLDYVRAAAGRDVIYLGSGDPDLSISQTARGDRGNDRLVGGPDGDRLRGDDGADVLIGKGGEDYLSSGLGADVLRGGAGDDILETVESREDQATYNVSELVLKGGAGDDAFTVRNDGSPDYVYCGDGNDRVYYVDSVDPSDVLSDCEATGSPS